MPDVAGADPCAALQETLIDALEQLAGDAAKRDKLRGELELDGNLDAQFPSPSGNGNLSLAAHDMFGADATRTVLEH